MKGIRTIMLAMLALGAGCQQRPPAGYVEPDLDNIAPEERTMLGLYLSARQAYEKWRADPQNVALLDVRTPAEYVFVGHATAARNIPIQFMDNRWDASTGGLVMRPNERFVAEVRRHYAPSDTLVVYCRSGRRAAAAVNALARAGFMQAYSVIDGFDGDAAPDDSNGARIANGWKNAGGPWTYAVEPDRAYLTGPVSPPRSGRFARRSRRADSPRP